MNNNENASESLTQKKELLNYLKEGNKITSLEAIQLFGITRLSARIFEIDELIGRSCNRETALVTNRYGRTVRVTRYWIEEFRRIKELKQTIENCGFLSFQKKKASQRELAELEEKTAKMFEHKK